MRKKLPPILLHDPNKLLRADKVAPIIEELEAYRKDGGITALGVALNRLRALFREEFENGKTT